MRSRTARVIQREPVLVRIGYYAVIKQDQNLRKKRVYLASTFASLFIIRGNQGRKSTGQEPEAGYVEVQLTDLPAQPTF